MKTVNDKRVLFGFVLGALQIRFRAAGDGTE